MIEKSAVSETEIAASQVWGDLPQTAIDSLLNLVKRFEISVSLGDVQYLNGRWYITHSGLFGIADRRRCSGLTTNLLLSCLIRRLAAGSSGQRFSSPPDRRGSSVTAMPILQTRLP